MPAYAFQTVDVFTEQRFTGNPLAVFTDARGMEEAQMQALAAEFNLSETTFVLPPADPANTARMRIFTPASELPFAGHPSIGTAYVLAAIGAARGDRLRLEVPAGIVAVELERKDGGAVIGARIEAPQPLSLGSRIPAETVAPCAGLASGDIIVANHEPLEASVGTPFLFAETTIAALARCSPNLTEVRRALAERPAFKSRFNVLLYARDGADVRARMFAPLSGVLEDPATGSANAVLGALLLHLNGEERGAITIRQGEEMGRPSLLFVTAQRRGESIFATVAGRCTPVLRGEALL
jgi:trans-2,3-dihydro-3-hydroxyanthranilate isomerase